MNSQNQHRRFAGALTALLLGAALAAGPAYAAIVCIETSTGYSSVEQAQLAGTLANLGHTVRETNTPTTSDCTVFVSHPGQVDPGGPSGLLPWVQAGRGVVQISDWGPDLISNSWNDVTEASPQLVRLHNTLHPITAGISPTWVSRGFWAYDYSGSDFIGFASSGQDLGRISGNNWGLTARCEGSGGLVYIGWNAFGDYALSQDLQLLQQAITWADNADVTTDGDSDGVRNACDNCPAAANAPQTDTDGDGVGDACDGCNGAGTTDGDGDGVCDLADNCPTTSNTSQADADNDDYGDACDSCTGFGTTDTDGDAICDEGDNCPAQSNPSQSNCDGDLLGDACDPDAVDADGDGVAGGCDNCPAIANPGQEDSDFDEIGDACDACEGFGTADADGDELCDGNDNCPAVANPSQADCDFDGIGDACDPDAVDSDGDGVDDACDNCPSAANPDQQDTDSDDFGDACDTCAGEGSVDTDVDTVCDEADNCDGVPNLTQQDSNHDGSGDACSAGVDISSIVEDGGTDLELTAAITHPQGAELTGTLVVTDCAEVNSLTFTWLATSCSPGGKLAFRINGHTAALVDADAIGTSCTCSPPYGIQTYTLPLAEVRAMLQPGANTIGLLKPDNGITALAWAYATITVNGVPNQQGLYDAPGGTSFGETNVCAANYTFSPVDVMAPATVGTTVLLSHPWTGDLPCSIDISSLGAGSCFTMWLSATDGLATLPSQDVVEFGITTETDLVRTDGSTCEDGIFCNGADQCVAGGCVHPGDPCTGGAQCNVTCNEATDDCFDPGGTPCTDEGNPCTTDLCNGAGVCAHPAGNNGAACRPPAGSCDVQENCDGTNSACPADLYKPDSEACRPSGGSCDVVENCTGTGPNCPADSFLGSSTECRPAVDVCDIAENCTGSSPACPADVEKPDGDVDGTCDEIDACTNINLVGIFRSRIVVRKQLTPAGDDRLRFTGQLVLPHPFSPALDPITHGARLVIQDSLGGVVNDTTIPPGAFSTMTHTGWKVNGAGDRWVYVNPSGVNGIVRAVIKDKSSITAGLLKFVVVGKNGDFPAVPNLPLRGTLVVDSPTAETGQCGEIIFPGPPPSPACQLKAAGDKVVCK